MSKKWEAVHLLAQSGFEPLESAEALAQFAIDHGAVTWQDGDSDITPESMYGHSHEYEAVA